MVCLFGLVTARRIGGNGRLYSQQKFDLWVAKREEKALTFVRALGEITCF
jgi:hypothetical protein